MFLSWREAHRWSYLLSVGITRFPSFGEGLRQEPHVAFIGHRLRQASELPAKMSPKAIHWQKKHAEWDFPLQQLMRIARLGRGSWIAILSSMLEMRFQLLLITQFRLLSLQCFSFGPETVTMLHLFYNMLLWWLHCVHICCRVKNVLPSAYSFTK